MMDQLIARFPEQIEEAISIGEKSQISPKNDIANVYVVGLGGSGIGGDFVSNFVRDEMKVPMITGKEYDIPAYVDSSTLGVVSSYSGNTEETLQAFALLKKQGSEIVCISSGGKILDIAKQDGNEYIKVPANWPSPRACLGYSVIQQLYILNKKGLTSSTYVDQLKVIPNFLRAELDDIQSRAQKIANFIYGKTAVIYSTRRVEPVAIRFRQQLNENAKALCWHNVIPEMNHNELVGWKDNRDDLVVIILRRKDDNPRNQTRIEISKDIVRDLCSSVIEIYAKGDNLIEQTFYLVHLVDWISWYLSELRGVDSMEVDVIDFLKAELAKS